MYFIKYETNGDHGQPEVFTKENIMADALELMEEIISRRAMILLVEKQP